MTNQDHTPIPRFTASVHYGSVKFEDLTLPCAYGGQPGLFTAFILVEGICTGLGIGLEQELERIQSKKLLSNGLFLVPFPTADAHGKVSSADYPAITLSRLHTWLALIPPEVVTSPEQRQKLENMQQELADVLYGYFGRPLLPPDMRAEEESYLSESERQFYRSLEEASQLPGRVNDLENQVRDLSEKIQRFTLRFEENESEEKINSDQQEQLRAMISMLGRKYQEKHGQGTFGLVETNLKKDHNFQYYKDIPTKKWPAIVRDCVRIYHTLYGSTASLPRVFELAQLSAQQKSLF